MKIKDLESGKITSLPNSKKCDQLKCIISVITKNKPHAHHKTHLHTMKVVTILIPSFYGLRYKLLGAWPPNWCPQTKKKNLETPVFLECHSAKASSTKKLKVKYST